MIDPGSLIFRGHQRLFKSLQRPKENVIMKENSNKKTSRIGKSSKSAADVEIQIRRMLYSFEECKKCYSIAPLFLT